MSLSSASVRRGVTVAMIYVVVIGFGIFSAARLALDMYPDVSFPLIGVVTTYPGAAPEDIEELITRPFEEAASSVEGVVDVTSTSKQGASIVFIEFEWGYDIDQGEIDVRKALEFYRDYLPPDAANPLTFAFNPSMQPIQFILISGAMDQAKLRRTSEREIEPLLERVPGVAAADTMGGRLRQIQVRVLAERLESYRLSVQEVVQALQSSNLQLPAGTIEQGGQEFTILSEGRFQSVDEIRNLVVTYRQAGLLETSTGATQPTLATRTVPVRLRDVAEVADTFEEPTRIVEANGVPSIFLVVRKQSGENTARTAEAVRDALPAIEAQHPDLDFQVLFDQSDFIRLSLGNLTNTAWQALLFTLFVLLFFLASLRASLVVAVSIPVSVVVTFGVMDQLGLTLNILSMAGLALSIGMLVDNAIVVLENITRLVVEEKLPAKEAAIRGAREVAMAISASTLTTICVFAPIPFVPGIAGLLFRDMALTIVVSLSASLLVALTLVPLLASWMLAHKARQRAPRFYERWLLGGVDALRRGYERSLRPVLRFRKTTVLLVFLVFVASLALGFRGLGFDFFPNSDQGISELEATAPVGTSLERTAGWLREAGGIILREVPEVEFVSTDTGIGEDFSAIFGKGAHAGAIRIKYKPRAERTRRQREIEVDILERLRRVPGIEIKVQQMNFGSTSDIEIELYADDLAVAGRVGRDVREMMSAVPGTADVTFSLEEGKPEYRVRLDREAMAARGVPALAVTNTIQAHFQGVVASRYREGGDDYDILVRAPKSRRLDERELRLLSVASLSGAHIPLSEIARVEPWVGPVEITRKNQRRMVTVGANVPGEDLGGVVDRVEEGLKAYALPEDVTYRIGGTAEDLRDTQRYMGLALLVAILLVYMVMASQFESLLEPLIIVFTMPLGAIGVAAVFLITGMTMSVPAIIGIVILVGVVVNNGIVLVDRANQSLRDEGKPLLEAIVDAGRLRMRPVLMTALTTTLGMVPLAAEIGEGSENWSPMARVMIGGLTAATFFTLYVIPALYVMFVGFVQRFREHGLLRLLPAYLGVLAGLLVLGAAGLAWLSTRPEAPPDLGGRLPLLLGSAAALAALLVAAAVGIRRRRVWGRWLGLVPAFTGLLAGLALVVLAALGVLGGRAEPPIVAGALLSAVALPVAATLAKRGREFAAEGPAVPRADGASGGTS